MAFIKDLSTIADSIRLEKEITNKMTIHDMAVALKPSLILVDWEGTILKYYDREEALALEDFPAPSAFPLYTEIDHEYLVFTEWNWTIQEAKSWLGVHKSTPLIVGAIYDTIDQKNHYEYINMFDTDILVSAKLHTNVFDNVDDPDYIEYMEAFTNLLSSSIFAFSFKSLSLGNNCTFPTKIVNEGTEDEREVPLLALCYFLNFNIPRNITTLPEEAFWTGSQEKPPCRIISLPATFKTIGIGAFLYAGLEYLSLPDEIESLSGEDIHGNSFKIFEFPNNELDLGYVLYSIAVEQDALILPPLISSIVDIEIQLPLATKAIVIEGTPTLCEAVDFSSISDAAEEILITLKAMMPYLKFYVPRSNLSWFESATNWCIIYNDFFEAIEDNIEYLESLGVNVDDYKGSEES